MKILIACGGTGGHMAPGIAIAQRLKELGHEATLAISRKSIDGRMAASYGDLTFKSIPGSGFSLRPIPLIKFVIGAARGFFTALGLLRRGNYSAAIAFGGFSALGVGLAAAVLRRPLYLHEANVKLGKAIRFLAPLAKIVFIPPQLKKRQPYAQRKKFQAAAYPLRRDFQLIDREDARKKLGLPNFGKLLLITGGSQGSKVLSQWMMDNVNSIAALGFHCISLGGLGQNCSDKFADGARGNTFTVRYLPFSDSMHLMHSAADIAICRAGAGTIAELLAATLPNVLVPYPSAAENHQLANALAMESEGASKVVEQRNLGMLLEVVAELADGDMCGKMKENLLRMRDCQKNGTESLSAAILRDLGIN
ncbi:MAG: UDP-N-acetylglucosamine--N-acetylmuramyl-(pentapeptide) pyrophosphoryl-undecaprenol N-acetylglucosamine transferase [Puniceicoccales bacterium]|nr:UDP-N-acetylglucosamine--N-acetylmuramyl-(pentapeptide) pyrophosphoryl-undecaprenol N-acetylglucosamine transferase [Puniceicoccales bacterium]